MRPANCEVDHTPPGGNLPRRAEAPAGHSARRARAVRDPLARGRRGDGRGRAGRATGPPTSPGRWWPTDATVAVARAARVRLARGDQARERAGGLRRWTRPAARCLDVGASTGGFTDCLLQRGARAVIALDVAYGELHWTLRQDPRVTVLERRNARELRPDELPYAPDLVVVDVSFISLAQGAARRAGGRGAGLDCLALVKPQFEVGRERGRQGRGGARRRTTGARRSWTVGRTRASGSAPRCSGTRPPGCPGPAGNRESFVWLAEPGRAGAVEDLEAAARRAEP